MFNLKEIVLALAGATIVISIWAIYYFIGRIIAVRHRWDQDMPSPAELHEMYEENNAIIEYRKHSPTD